MCFQSEITRIFHLEYQNLTFMHIVFLPGLKENPFNPLEHHVWYKLILCILVLPTNTSCEVIHIHIDIEFIYF